MQYTTSAISSASRINFRSTFSHRNLCSLRSEGARTSSSSPGIFVRGLHRLRDLPIPNAAGKARLEPFESSSTSNHCKSRWTSPPTTVLLVQKPNDPRTTAAMGRILRHLRTFYPHLQLIVEPHTAQDHPLDDLTVVSPVITLGGDGTVLHVSNLFSKGECPPVLCFSMGSLGFLLPFHIDSLASAVDMTLNGPVSVLNRLRLACNALDKDGNVLGCATGIRSSTQAGCFTAHEQSTPGAGKSSVGWQVMNEVTLHRGRQPHLAVVDAFFNDQHLTEAVADGLLLSTPTGSTAYSLSAGGPISHPETDAFLLTPIAPRSLSFRTVILPGQGVVRLQISPLARAPAELSIDGREVCELKVHESVVIQKSPFPIPCIERTGGGTGWVRDINSLLQFNTGFRNKSLGHGI